MRSSLRNNVGERREKVDSVKLDSNPPQRQATMANVVDNDKDVYYLDMVMKVLHDDKSLIQSYISARYSRKTDQERSISALLYIQFTP